jgi:nucleoside-diphosphate-sugar epimerase
MTNRVVVVGAGGFVGGAIAKEAAADGHEVVCIDRAMIDLLAPTAADQLAELIRTSDCVVFAAAEAPCKTPESLERNIALVFTVLQAIWISTPTYLMNVSSDAVYLDGATPLSETSPIGPANLHGAMHAAREALLNTAPTSVIHIRPTLIYGFGDPHNGYGPNQFLSRIRSGADIQLFGNGEERRDHVHIGDVGSIAARCLLKRPTGSLNVASGEVQSFREIAERAVKLSGGKVQIRTTPRNGPMPHGGYRPIAIDQLRELFPDFVPIKVLGGLALEVATHGS